MNNVELCEKGMLADCSWREALPADSVDSLCKLLCADAGGNQDHKAHQSAMLEQLWLPMKKHQARKGDDVAGRKEAKKRGVCFIFLCWQGHSGGWALFRKQLTWMIEFMTEVCKETKLVLQNAATFSSLRPRQTRLIMEHYVKRKVFTLVVGTCSCPLTARLDDLT